MPKINQIYALVNSYAAEALGSSAITVKDASTLVALGDYVFGQDSVDVYVKTMVDRIGKTVVSTRVYEGVDPTMLMDTFTYGVIRQKLFVDLPDAQENSSWEIGDEGFEPKYAPVMKPTIKQKLFEKMSTFEIDITIPDNILRTAFTSAEQMGALISGIFVAIDNRMTLALENCKELTRAAFIARKLKDAKPCGAINLLSLYNTETGNSLTVDKCMMDKGFLSFAAAQIKMWTKRMRKMSKLFNDEGYARHTPQSELVLTMLDNFDSSLTAYLEADTFHNDLVHINGFSTVPYWQASGTSFAFDDVSKVNVKLSEEDTIEQTGILAVAYDYEAMGVGIDDRHATTERNNRSEYTNYYNKVTRMYFNDMSENGIVFYVADAV